MGQRGDLAGRQMPPGARRQAGQANAADADADQARDGVAERRQHPAHLTVAAFINGQLHFSLPCAALVLLATQQAHILGGPGHAVVQHDSAPEPPQCLFAGNARNGHAVCFWHMVARMGQLEQKIAVVGQKDQPFTVGV